MIRQRIPKVAIACAMLAFAHSFVWALVQPPLQAPDEPSHIAMVQYITETGGLPDAFVPATAPSLSRNGNRLQRGIGFSSEGPPVWSPGQAAATRRALQRPEKVQREGSVPYRNNPPVYYLVQAAAVSASGAETITTRTLVMRLGSALLAALAVFFAVMFIRELLPTRPWAWAVGGVALALLPLLGFLGGGVNPEIMAAAEGSALLWLVARAFRRGVTPRLALLVAAVAAVGLLTRVTFVGLLPGVAIAIAIAAWRTEGFTRRRIFVTLGAAACVFVAIWAGLGVAVLDRPLLGPAGGAGSAPFVPDLAVAEPQPPTPTGYLAYVWQFYLPRLPFMADQLNRPPDYPLFDDWVKGFVGRFGWFQYEFPEWVYVFGALVVAGIIGLAARALLARDRRRLRNRGTELACYIAILIGTLAFVHYAGYTYRLGTGFNLEQARYLAPVFALYPALLAVALVALRDHWRRIGAGALGGLVVGHAVAAVLLAIQRYYV